MNKGIRFWQVFVLILVVCGIAGGTYGVYNYVTNKPAAASSIPANTQTAVVQTGNLSTTVSSSGSVVFPTVQDVKFASTGTLKAVYVTAGQTVKVGDKIAELDSVSITQLRVAVSQALANMQTTQEAVATYMSPYTQDDFDAAQAVIDKARLALSDAQAKAPLDLADAQYTLYKAEQTYWSNYDKLNRQLIQWQDLDNSKNAWDRAKLNLDLATRNINQTIADAQAALTKAQTALQTLKDYKTDPVVLDAKQSQVTVASQALTDAQYKLSNAVITAPIDGIATSVPVVAGQNVGMGTLIAQITDVTDIEVSGTLDEIDVPSVNVGQKVNVSLSALPSTTITGSVYTIATSGRTQSGIVTYAVYIKITPPKDVTLRSGMSATANIIVQQVNNVLLVPNQAVTGSGTRATVNVVVNDAIEPRTVTLGMTDGTRSEVTAGLQAGDQVVLRTSTSSSTSRTTTTTRTTGTGTFSGFPVGGASDFPAGGAGGPVIIQGR